MIRNIGIFLAFLLILLIPTFSFANGQIEHDPLEALTELLKDENTRKFFSNQRSGDFHENFVRKTTQEPSNSIIIKAGTSVKLSDTIERQFSTILVEGDLRIIDTGNSALRVQKIIIAPSGSLTIGNSQNPIEADKKGEIVFVSTIEGE